MRQGIMPNPFYDNPGPHHDPYAEPPKPYAYQYGVSDQYTGTNFAANENSDAKVIYIVYLYL